MLIISTFTKYHKKYFKKYLHFFYFYGIIKVPQG